MLIATYGLWPDDHERIINEGLANGSRSDVRRDFVLDRERLERGELYTYRTCISAEQMRVFDRLVSEDWRFRLTSNCASFASEVFEEATGFDIDADDTGGFESPREIGESIVEANGGLPRARRHASGLAESERRLVKRVDAAMMSRWSTTGAALLLPLALASLGGCASLAARASRKHATWSYLGGVAVGEPMRDGASTRIPITILDPGWKNDSSIVPDGCEGEVDGSSIVFFVRTCLAGREAPVESDSVRIRDLPAGPYDVYYLDPDGTRHLAGRITLAP